MTATAIKLPDELINQARIQAKIDHRSVPKQIEHWSKIGQIIEEHPDLPYTFIKNILTGLEEVKAGKVEPYHFGDNLTENHNRT